MTDLPHALNVSILAKKIGQQMKLDEQAIAILSTAAMFHDIGKMSLPPALLDKPTALTPDEYQIIQWHTTLGYNILSNMPDDIHREAAEVALFHHERNDSSGYMRLARNQIPLMARITAVADVYDALTSDRPYRKAWERQAANAYMLEHAGSHFDENIVEALISSLK